MSAYAAPKEPPADFELNDVTQGAAQALVRMLERDHDEVPEWVRKAAEGVDPKESVPSDVVDEPREPPGGAPAGQRAQAAHRVVDVRGADSATDIDAAAMTGEVLTLIETRCSVEPTYLARVENWARSSATLASLPLDGPWASPPDSRWQELRRIVDDLCSRPDERRHTSELRAALLRDLPQLHTARVGDLVNLAVVRPGWSHSSDRPRE